MHCIGTEQRTSYQIIPLYKIAAILADDIFKCIFVNENDKIWFNF